MKSFLMMGQSNMAGRGSFDDVPQLRNPHTFMLRNGLWQPLTEPINCDRPIKMSGKLVTNSGIGPAASFADAYAKHFNEDVGVIPCAEGGSSLNDWRIDGQLFLHAYYMAKLAMNTSDLLGIIWHQGEAEAHSPATSSTYCERFLAIIRELESRLGIKLKVVVGELGRFYTAAPYLDAVNAQLNSLSELDDFVCVSSEGLTDRGDALHFNSESQREFGRRYFDGWLKLDGRE